MADLQIPLPSQAPIIFVSHRHSDKVIVQAFVNVLEKAFQLNTGDIRCTALTGYGLYTGDKIGETLRNAVAGAKLVVGMIGPNTSESEYCLFELGASWVLNKVIFPVLFGGAVDADVPGPLKRDMLTRSLSDQKDCHVLVNDIAKATSLPRRSEPGPLFEAITVLSNVASAIAAENWKYLPGDPGWEAESEVSWVDFEGRPDFRRGERVRLFLGDRIGEHQARQIMVRFLCVGQNKDRPVGVIPDHLFNIPIEGLLDVTIPDDFSRVRSVSVHGGPEPWGLIRIPGRNGTPKLLGVAVLKRQG